MSTKAPYHTRLEAPDSIRLLKLHHNAVGVSGELATFSLRDDTQTCPPYTTISYTWGDAHSDEPIQVDGHHFRVRANLRPLLAMLCSSSSGNKPKHFFDGAGGSDWLWIDSICINQDDLAERAAQVKAMGRIFGRAAQAAVWLGERSDATDRAMDLLSLLEERRRELQRRGASKRRRRMPPGLEEHPGWASLEQLLRNPWWGRVWTLQEFLLPERLRFYCGAKSISRQTFRRGVDALQLCGPMEDRVKTSVWTTAWNRRRISDWYQFQDTRHRMSLVSLMAFCGDYGVKDHRDRIWGVHGLAREEDRLMIGDPTYDTDVKTLFGQLVRRFVERYTSLDIICYAQLFPSGEPDWPSWVPDWQVSLPQPPVVPLMVSQSANEHLANFRPINPSPARKSKQPAAFRASGHETPRVLFSDSGRCVTCQGLTLDAVDGLGAVSQADGRRLAPAVGATSPANTAPPADMQEKEGLLHSLVRSVVLDRMDKFLERRAPVRQYARELMALVAVNNRGGHHLGEDGAASNPWFGRWWEDVTRDAALRARGFTMDALCGVEGQHPLGGSSHQLPVPTTSKSFFSRLRGTMRWHRRRLMVTDAGRIGLGPRNMQKGDVVCVLFGCSVPVVLRRLDQPQLEDGGGRLFRFIGECYLDGFMDGEALELGKASEDFTMM